MRATPSLVIVCVCLFGLAVPDALPNETQHAGAIISHIPRVPVDSTAIAAIGYSKRLHALESNLLTARSTAMRRCRLLFTAR